MIVLSVKAAGDYACVYNNTAAYKGEQEQLLFLASLDTLKQKRWS